MIARSRSARQFQKIFYETRGTQGFRRADSAHGFCFSEDVMPENKIRLTGRRYVRLDECAKIIPEVHGAYHELAWRKDWLLWHIEDFRKEFMEISNSVGFKPSGHGFTWLSISNFCNREGIHRHEFVKKYGLSCHRVAIRMDEMIYQLERLIKEAGENGFGLNVENFRRDKACYELREDWPELWQAEREFIVKWCVTCDVNLSDEETCEEKEKLLLKKKLPYREVAKYLDEKFAVAVDRIVLHDLVKLDHRILKKIGPNKNLAGMKEEADWRDSHLLYSLGMLKKVKALYTDFIETPQIESFPVKKGGERRFIKDERYFVRFNYPIEMCLPPLFEELTEEWWAKGCEKLRRRFLKERERYISKLGSARLENIIKNAVKNMKNRIKKLELFYTKAG